MKPSHWGRLQAALSSLTECKPEERDALMQRICGQDESLRAELESLLRQFDAEPDFLEQPPSGAGALQAELRPDDMADDDSLIGSRIGNWTIRRRIDRGGMGSVYLGERDDVGFEQQAAIKVIARGMDSETIIERFHAERRILAALDHPNIASILDGGMTADDRPWFAMPYLEGAVPFDEYCDKQQLSLTERLQLMLSVCAAVQFAHQNLVIHRDLKPGNILVTPSGIPMLLDFGIAKLLDNPGKDLTMLATQVFTPHYASPEQKAGAAVTTASDVYQLGVLLYQLLCGASPQGMEPGTDHIVPRPSECITADAASLRGETVAGLRRRLRGDLDTICLQALHPEPQRRYRSAEALGEDLSRALNGLPVQARPDTFAYRAGKFLRRNRWSASLATGLFILAIGFGVFASISASRLAEQERTVSLERDRAQATADFLMELFTDADPTRAEREYTATEMLERGLQRLENDNALQASERAAVLAVAGGVFQVRGDYERARGPLAEAVALGQQGDIDGEPYFLSLLELSKLEYRLGNFTESERLARAALDVLDGMPGAELAVRASTLNQIALALSDQGQVGEAAAILEQVVELRHTLPGAETDQDLAANLNNLGLMYVELGQLDRAEMMYNEALPIVERGLGARHPYAAFLRHSRAELHELRGNRVQAQQDLQDALTIAVETLGDEHPFVLEVRQALESMEEGAVP